MDNDDLQRQERLHEAIERDLTESGELRDGDLLTSWVVVYELTNLGEKGESSCGHFYGPRDMTAWRALGLVEWVRRHTIGPKGDDE